MNIKRIFHSLSLRLPQSIALRNGMRVNTFDTMDNSLFWSIFTSSEYLSFVPYLIRSGVKPKLVIDCGAACGYFSLLIEHLCRSKVLDWEPNYILVEPASRNFSKLKENFDQGIFEGRVKLENKLAGKLSGRESFFESSSSPWSSSVNDRSSVKSQKTLREYIDLTAAFSQPGCFLKIDIEGGEFEFLNTYVTMFHNVCGIIIEWHHEMGDVSKAATQLVTHGFYMAKTSFEKENRSVQLFLRNQQ